jgi:hypothetical protein
MLEFDKDKRITAEEACKHPYFNLKFSENKKIMHLLKN